MYNVLHISYDQFTSDVDVLATNIKTVEQCFDVIKRNLIKDQQQLEQYRNTLNEVAYYLPERTIDKLVQFQFELSKTIEECTMEVDDNGVVLFNGVPDVVECSDFKLVKVG